jgi:type IV pilus assembly protein PilW
MMRSRGFTLIELMVAVALGLLTTLIIAQVFLQSEGNKRTTTGGSDAQVAGALALYALQRDIQTAGYGLTAMPAAIGCPTTAQKSGTAVLTSAPLVPVSITFGASTASDSITVFYSMGTTGFSVPMKVSADHAQTDASFTVPSTWGLATNDLLLAVPATWVSGSKECTLLQATSSATDSTTVIQNAVSGAWNTSLSAIMPASGYPTGSALLNLGSAPVRRTYSVSSTNWTLQGQDMGAAARDLFPQIVMIKAMYGKSSVASGPVTSFDVSTPTTNAGWRLVQSIRLVVVARSGQKEKKNSAGNCDATPAANLTTSPPTGLVWDVGSLSSTGSTCNTSSKCVALDVSATDTDWNCYRYKVFDTVVPLRNAVWNQ